MAAGRLRGAQDTQARPGRFTTIVLDVRIRVSALLLMACCLAGCTAQQAAPAEPLAAFQPYLGRSLSYLARQVDNTGLLHAATGEDTARHWLAPDNKLALWAFETAHAPEAATKLRTTMAALPAANHGLIEALNGETIPWPPHAAVQQEVQPGIWAETYGGEIIADWEKDCYLDLIAALHAWNVDEKDEAQRLYAEAMDIFDAAGCLHPDSPGAYRTRDLALAIFAGARIGAPVDRSRIDALLTLQTPSGGFTTEYTAAGPTGATTTVDTAYAALALMAVRQE